MKPTERRITISIVLYRNDPEHVIQLVKSITNSSITTDVYFIDNSPDNSLEKFIPTNANMHYNLMSINRGYGQANNEIMRSQLKNGDYHLVMNADVYFEKSTLESLLKYMDKNEDVGLLLPRVLNPDHTEQPLFKLLPSPQDLFVRRFIPRVLKRYFEAGQKRYCMAFADVKETFEAPYLSGCFMFIRKKALKDVGVFDPRFFLYCEDVDLSRRIRQKWRTVYHGGVSIYHYFQRGSLNNPKLLLHHTLSAIKYFNKYGWIYDSERTEINKNTLKTFIIIDKTLMSASIK